MTAASCRSSGPSLLLRDVEVAGRRTDCRVRVDLIAEIGPDLPATPETAVVDGRGGALIPGLADHHLHLFALAVADSSVDLTADRSLDALRLAASNARPTAAWVRAVGWDDERHGPLDRDWLDRVAHDVPIRLQHRSGSLWVLNSPALDLLGGAADAPAGAERDDAGRLTGRVWRSDRWLHGHGEGLPDLAAVGARLARLGVTEVTDASPDLDCAAVAAIGVAVRSGALPQRVQLLGAATVPAESPRVVLGPRKLVVDDHVLPSPDELAMAISQAHDASRAVAVHCVSRAALALTIAALRAAGSRPGDRVEHCAVADLTAAEELRELGVAVVTQPTLVARRGDDYLDRHDVGEHADLWRYRSLLDVGVPVVASSDAPYGDVDPWATIRAARDRRTPGGRVLGPAERAGPEVVLSGLWAAVERPAGPPRRVAVGEPADLVLLRTPLQSALASPESRLVAATVAAGRLAYLAEGWV